MSLSAGSVFALPAARRALTMGEAVAVASPAIGTIVQSTSLMFYLSAG